MKIFRDKDSLGKHVKELRSQDLSIGFVPTMGSLHKGHISLVKRARKDNPAVICSIFVNPTQFNNKEDFEKYPQDLERDIQMLEDSGCDAVFIPRKQQMYPSGEVAQKFNLGKLNQVMEGRYRSGHFDGVATIVKRLFEAVRPYRAYFGEKDFQQLAVIKKMAKIEQLPVEVIGCPIIREENGLASSSRNKRLTCEERSQASFIYQSLLKARELSKKLPPREVELMIKDDFNGQNLIDLEYFTIAREETLESAEDYTSGKVRAFAAAYISGVRLIDNMRLN